MERCTAADGGVVLTRFATTPRTPSVLRGRPDFAGTSLRCARSTAGTGTCSLEVTQSGNDTYAPAAPARLSLQATKATQVITFTPPSPEFYGGVLTLTATGGSSGKAVNFSVDPRSSATCTLTGNTLRFVGTGNCQVSATQAGDEDYLAASTAYATIAVVDPPAPPSTPSTPSATGGAVTGGVTAGGAVSGGIGFAATGTLSALVAAAPLVSAITPTSGPSRGGTTVTISGSNLADATSVRFGSTGAHFTVTANGSIVATSPAGTGSPTISIDFAGDSSLSAGSFDYTSTATPEVVPTPLVVGVTLARSGKDVGTAVIFHATLSAGSSMKGGTVTFTTASFVFCKAAVVEGEATCSRSTLPRSGAMKVVGTYTPGPGGGKSLVAAISTRVAPEKVFLSALATKLANGKEQLRARVVPAHGGFGPPRGFVTFFLAKKALCAGKVVHGRAVCSLSEAVTGKVMAKYRSGADYLPAHAVVRLR